MPRKAVIPPRRWIPVDVWLTLNRIARDAELGAPISYAEVEKLADMRRSAGRSSRR